MVGDRILSVVDEAVCDVSVEIAGVVDPVWLVSVVDEAVSDMSVADIDVEEVSED